MVGAFTKLIFSLFFFIATIHAGAKEQERGKKERRAVPYPLEFVDEHIGTGSAGYGIGQNNPAAQAPFGALRLGPDTSFDAIYIQFNHFGGYYYPEGYIRAFSHTHVVGAGLPDFGNFGVMPISQEAPENNLIRRHGYRSSFSHASEVIDPGYYSVFLDTHGVQAELTAAGTHAGIHRYTFQVGQPMTILLDVCHTVTSDSIIGKANTFLEKEYDVKLGTFTSPSKEDAFESEATCPLASVELIQETGLVKINAYVLSKGSLSKRNGRGLDTYFHGTISTSSTPLLGSGHWRNGLVFSGTASRQNETSGSLGLYLYFGIATEEANEIVLNTGISFVSQQNAARNLQAQVGEKSFDQVLDEITNHWAQILSKVARVESSNVDEKIKFYTALYRTYMSPTIFSESDGSYLGMDNKVHFIEPGHNYYSDLSLWDTFRTQNPWLTMIAPDVATDIVRSMILMYQEGGEYSRWPLANVYTSCMFGDNHILVILDSYIKGLRDFDLKAAYPGLRQTAVGPRPIEGRGGILDYITYGFVPLETSNTGTGLTLAYAYADYALSVLAKELGYTEDALLFQNRSFNYKNIWEPTTQLMCPKFKNGSFQCPEHPAFPFHPNYVEGNVWHYNWDVPHDLEGLVALYPSKEEFIKQLSTMFDNSTQTNQILFQSNILPNPYYWAGNEHNLLFPWVFHAGDRPDLTQYWTRWINEHRYSAKPNGLPGNDDYGTMSAWFTFASLGLYPLTGKDWYFVGSPVFDEVDLTIPHPTGTSIVKIVTFNNSKENVYVERVELNGVPLERPYIAHQQLLGNPTLHFWMTSSQTNCFSH